MEKLIREGSPMEFVIVKGKKKINRKEPGIINLIISKRGVEKTELAHERLLNLGDEISKKTEWKNVKGREVEEFLKFRE